MGIMPEKVCTSSLVQVCSDCFACQEKDCTSIGRTIGGIRHNCTFALTCHAPSCWPSLHVMHIFFLLGAVRNDAHACLCFQERPSPGHDLQHTRRNSCSRDSFPHCEMIVVHLTSGSLEHLFFYCLEKQQQDI